MTEAGAPPSTSEGVTASGAQAEVDAIKEPLQMPLPMTDSPIATPKAVASAPAPSGTIMPRAEAYQLPLAALQALAAESGLQWVNSDADKVAAVQAMIAAEPPRIHVPRERPAPVIVDDGPLVLVETRRDLAELRLPFES